MKIYKIGDSPMINNKGEKSFEEIMKSRGFTLIYQPYLKEFKIRPDFYCIEEHKYYEVISTRQAFHARKIKMEKALKSGLNLILVNPDGTPYLRGNFKKWKMGLKPKKCLRCGREWTPRKTEVRQCPYCKSAYFDVPRKEMKK